MRHSGCALIRLGGVRVGAAGIMSNFRDDELDDALDRGSCVMAFRCRSSLTMLFRACSRAARVHRCGKNALNHV